MGEPQLSLFVGVDDIDMIWCFGRDHAVLTWQLRSILNNMLPMDNLFISKLAECCKNQDKKVPEKKIVPNAKISNPVRVIPNSLISRLFYSSSLRLNVFRPARHGSGRHRDSRAVVYLSRVGVTSWPSAGASSAWAGWMFLAGWLRILLRVVWSPTLRLLNASNNIISTGRKICS